MYKSLDRITLTLIVVGSILFFAFAYWVNL